MLDWLYRFRRKRRRKSFLAPLLLRIVQQQGTIMANFSRLNTAVTDLQAAVAANTVAVDKAVAAINSSTDQAAIDAAATAVEAATATIKADDAKFDPPAAPEPTV